MGLGNVSTNLMTITANNVALIDLGLNGYWGLVVDVRNVPSFFSRHPMVELHHIRRKVLLAISARGLGF